MAIADAIRQDRARRAKAPNLIAPPAADTPRILLYDIETMAALVWVWNQWQTNVIATEHDWYILGFAYHWLGQDATGWVSVFQDPAFTPDTDNDQYVADRLLTLFDQADVTVAHNGDKFDRRKANARFLYWGLGPPSPYQTVDTKKEAQRYFANYSNALDELGRVYGIGRKKEHRGFPLWRECAAGSPAAWAEMEEYCRADVDLLESWYLRLLPWIGNPGQGQGVNVGLWTPGEEVCPKCGGTRLIRRGTHRTRFSEFQTFQCAECKGYSRARKRERGHVGLI